MVRRVSTNAAAAGRLPHRRRTPLSAACLIAVAVAACGGQPTPSAKPAPGLATRSPAVATATPRSGGTPTTTPASTPAGSPSGAPARIPRTPFGFAARGMRGEVMAFVRADDLTYARSTLDLGAISTLVFFSLSADAGGDLTNAGSAWRSWTSTTMDAVVARAHRAGVRVVYSLARFGWDPAGTSVSDGLLASATARQRLASEAAAEVVRRGVDGVNVDFEPIPAGRAAAFDDFVRRLRLALDHAGQGYQLTVDVVGHFDSYDVPGLVRAGADAIYLMGYHYAGSWSTSAGSTDPYGGVRYDVPAAVALLRESVPASKLIVGVPFYGHLWPTASGAAFARTTGPGVDVLLDDALAIGAAHGIRDAPSEHAAWSAWQERACSTCAATWVQLWFDDAATLAWKWAWIRDQGLLGTGVWTMPYEGSPGPVTAALTAIFRPGAP